MDAFLQPEQNFVVTCSETEISCRRPDGTIEAVLWSELQAVLIETNDQGPLACDVFWIVVGETGGCVVPQGATGEKELMERLQTLEGFDNDAVIQAMLSTSNQRFLCWKKT